MFRPAFNKVFSSVFASVFSNDSSPVWFYGEIVEPLAFDALTFDPSTYEMLGVKTGTGDLSAVSSSTHYAPDHEGIYREYAANTAVWSGGRTVRNNAVSTDDISYSGYTMSGGATVTGTDTLNMPSENDGVLRSDNTGVTGSTSIFTVELSGTGTVSILSYVTGSSFTFSQITLTSTPTRYSQESTVSTGISQRGYIRRRAGDTATQVTVGKYQLETTEGRSDTTIPSEYVANAGLTGTHATKTYANENGNTVTDNVVTEAVGAALPEVPYLQYYPAATNSAIYSNDFTNAAWVKTTMTAALTQTGINGAANYASLLTATGANSTALQTVTAASGEHASKFYLKRSIGTGVIEITVDGTTWTAVTLTTSYQSFEVAQAAVTNPQVGIRIVTSGDAVICGNGECYL